MKKYKKLHTSDVTNTKKQSLSFWSKICVMSTETEGEATQTRFLRSLLEATL